MAEVSLIDIAVGLAKLEGSVTAYRESVLEYKADNAAIRAEINQKHQENRKSIHEIRNDLQEIRDEQSELRMKIKQVLIYAGAGGMIAGTYGKSC